MHAIIPIRLAGLCNGAKSLHSFIASITSSSIITDLANFSPPCTILCPTAPTSLKSLITPVFAFVSALITN